MSAYTNTNTHTHICIYSKRCIFGGVKILTAIILVRRTSEHRCSFLNLDRAGDQNNSSY